MELKEASELARKVMSDHKLDGWNFKIDFGKRRAGCCCYRTKTISLSRHYIELNTVTEIMDTILHEIAHALTPGAKHGPIWKAKCVEIGAKPERCYDSKKVNMPLGKWVAKCPKCSYVVRKHRLSKKNTAFVWHSMCGKDAVMVFKREE